MSFPTELENPFAFRPGENLGVHLGLVRESVFKNNQLYKEVSAHECRGQRVCCGRLLDTYLFFLLHK